MQNRGLAVSDDKVFFGTVFYDLTSASPVERMADSTAVDVADGGNWTHSAVIGAYNDAELASIIAYLRSVAP